MSHRLCHRLGSRHQEGPVILSEANRPGGRRTCCPHCHHRPVKKFTNRSRRSPCLRGKSRPYFSHSLKNKYLPRNSSFCASGVALKCITGHPSAGEYTGHFASPGPFGSPLRAKLVQYFCIIALSARSSGRHVTSVFESSCPNTYSISAE